MYSDKEKEKANNRERQRRYREKHANQGVPPGVTNTPGVTPAVKMLCRCQYFVVRNGVLVCQQCGKPAPARPIQDKARRGIVTK